VNLNGVAFLGRTHFSPFRARQFYQESPSGGSLQSTWKKTKFTEKKTRGINANRIAS
jgi:hypothetical protein